MLNICSSKYIHELNWDPQSCLGDSCGPDMSACKAPDQCSHQDQGWWRLSMCDDLTYLLSNLSLPLSLPFFGFASLPFYPLQLSLFFSEVRAARKIKLLT